MKKKYKFKVGNKVSVRYMTVKSTETNPIWRKRKSDLHTGVVTKVDTHVYFVMIDQYGYEIGASEDMLKKIK